MLLLSCNLASCRTGVRQMAAQLNRQHTSAGRVPLHAAGARHLSSSAPAAPDPDPEPAAPKASAPPNRHVVTAEVIVSKILPAGFGWQASSVVAGDMGFEADTLSFALTTGVG